VLWLSGPDTALLTPFYGMASHVAGHILAAAQGYRPPNARTSGSGGRK
jgi:hypothetical protein